MNRHRFVVALLATALAVGLAGCAKYESVGTQDTGGAKKPDAAPSEFAVEYSAQEVSDADAATADYPNEDRTFKKSMHFTAVTSMEEGPYPKATSCLSCKSSNFLGVVNDRGAAAVYGQEYAQARPDAGLGMTCFNCHADTPGTLRVTNKAFAEGLGAEAQKVDIRSLACMQCHAESYVDTKTGQTMFPYKYGFDPASMLKYYDEIGFADRVDEKTGAKLLSVEHGQGESFVGGSHYSKGVDCPDCHTMKATTVDGDEYTDHTFVFSMETPEVMAAKCLKGCHNGKTVEELKEQVRRTEAKGIARMQTARARVDEFYAALAEAVAANQLSAEKLEQARTLYRHADFYAGTMRDSPLGEGNGNIFHNNLDLVANAEKAEALSQEGMKLLGR